jgi:succinate dehydrogenase / fumarate reductase cytochrome b subunit
MGRGGFDIAALSAGGVLQAMESVLRGDVHNAYALVSNLFQSRLYDLLYIAGGILVGLHISHGFWSAFQTIGFSNQIWLKRLDLA